MAKQFTAEYMKSVAHLYINGKPIEEITNEYGIPRATFFIDGLKSIERSNYPMMK